jgi:hypothetical protein
MCTASGDAKSTRLKLLTLLASMKSIGELRSEIGSLLNHLPRVGL